MSARRHPGTSTPGALDTLVEAIPEDARAIAPLEGAAYDQALAALKDTAWGQLTERDYERWNGQLVIAIWRLQGRIPGWTMPTFVGETPE